MLGFVPLHAQERGTTVSSALSLVDFATSGDSSTAFVSPKTWPGTMNADNSSSEQLPVGNTAINESWQNPTRPIAEILHRSLLDESGTYKGRRETRRVVPSKPQNANG